VLSGLSFVASPAVAAAGKSISCTTVVTGTECILWGLDTTAIPNGVIATANFNVSASATGSLAIGITGASASSATGMALGTNGLGTALDVVQLSTLVCSPQTLLTPGTASCTVTLTAAPTSAVALPLGDIVSAAQVTMPTSITVPEGATSATFNVQVAAVTSPTTLTVTASDPSSFNITLQPPSNSTFTPIRVRAGGAAYTDPSGNVWSADTDFSGGTKYSTTHAITNTTTQPLYQEERYGNFDYKFTVPNGSHTVTLKFAELYWDKAGERVFDVAINGVTVLSNFDIFAKSGAEYKALDESFSVSVTTGTITIQFTTVVNDAKIDAIEIQ
jgi:malectin (di-glucose binding ER protein)